MSNPFLVAFPRNENFSAVSTDTASFTKKFLPDGQSYASVSSGSTNFMTMTYPEAYPKSVNAYTNTANTWQVGTLPKPQDPCFIATAPSSGVLASTYADGTQSLVTVEVKPMTPVVGVNADGQQVNTILDNNSQIKTAGYEKSFSNGAIDDYTSIKVTALHKSSVGVYAVGTATKRTSGNVNVAWIKSVSNYDAFKRTSIPTTPWSLSYADGKYIIATGTNVNHEETSALSAPSPVGGFNVQVPNVITTSNASINVDTLSSDETNVIAVSENTEGVYKTSTITSNGNWNHIYQQKIQVLCKKYTSYTFPGEVDNGLVAQIVKANTTGDTPPTEWSTNIAFTPTGNVESYHGLTSPAVSVSWVKSA